MRILIVNRFFWPDESASAMLASDLAEDLAAAGHEVHVLCSRILYDRAGERLPSREVWRGVNVHRLYSTGFGRGSGLRRLLDLATLHASLHLAGPFACKPDAIFVMTDPPMALGAALWVRALRGGRICHHVDDLYPDIAVALGAMHPAAWSTRLLAWRYRRWLRHCTKILALGEYMERRLIEKGVPSDRLAITPPWADGTRIKPAEPSGNGFRKELGLSDADLLVLYAGNMGRGHAFDAILYGAARIKNLSQVHFAFVGGGSRRAEIEGKAQSLGLPRVRFLPYQPRERLGEMLAAGDVHLVAQDERSVGLIVPSKLAGILAAGRPVIFTGPDESEIACCMATYRCGLVVSPADGAGFAEAVERLARNSAERAEMGTRARAAFERHFDRTLVVGKIRRLLEEMCEPNQNT